MSIQRETLSAYDRDRLENERYKMASRLDVRGRCNRRYKAIVELVDEILSDAAELPDYRDGILQDIATTVAEARADVPQTPVPVHCIGGCGDTSAVVDLDANNCCPPCAERYCEHCKLVRQTTRPVRDYDPTGPGSTSELRCWGCCPPSRDELDERYAA